MDEAAFAADFLQLWEPIPLSSSTASARSRPPPSRPAALPAVEEDGARPMRLTAEGTRSIVTMLAGVGKQCMIMVGVVIGIAHALPACA